MSAKGAAVVLGVVLLAIAGVLALLVVLSVLPWILVALGLALLVGLLAALVVGALVLIVALPYYWATKPATASPTSGATLEKIREP